MIPRRRMARSVPPHFRIHDFGPAVDAPRQVEALAVASLPQELNGVAAPAAGAAIDHDLAVFGQLLELLGKRGERDLHGSRQVADRPLVWLANVEQREGLAAVAFLLQHLDRDGRGLAEHRANDTTATLDFGPWTLDSIPGHPRVHDLGPAVDPARQVPDLAEAGLAEELDRAGAAAAGLAVDHDLIDRREPVAILGHPAQRDLHGFREG